MKTTGARLRELREQAGMTMQQVGDLFGMTRQSVSDWEADRTKPEADKLPVLARRFHTTSDYILTGKPAYMTRSPTPSYEVESGPDTKRTLPLISWVTAGGFDEAFDPFAPGVAEEWLPAPRKVSAHAYWLRVKGDSMFNPTGGRSYAAGSLICVDPELRLPNSGQPVIAKLDGDNQVTFKVFVDEDGERWLRPLNPAYPPIRTPFKVLGTVVGKWEDA